MTRLRKAITAACIAVTTFAGGMTPMNAQTIGGGKECSTEMVIDDIVYTEWGLIVYYHYEQTCVTILD